MVAFSLIVSGVMDALLTCLTDRYRGDDIQELGDEAANFDQGAFRTVRCNAKSP